MTTLIRLDAGRPVIVSAAAPVIAATTGPRVVEGGRGDARLATYKKPAPADAKAKDWREDGLVLLPTDAPEILGDHLPSLDLLAVAFPKFNDGRGMSIAVLLRKRLGYSGDLRAIGDVARDQLFFMARCGFTSFALRADQDPEDALRAFGDFSDVYQSAADGRSSLFLRRGP
jgi:uncharacterized protein (DUF934 family)